MRRRRRRQRVAGLVVVDVVVLQLLLLLHEGLLIVHLTLVLMLIVVVDHGRIDVAGLSGVVTHGAGPAALMSVRRLDLGASPHAVLGRHLVGQLVA